MFPMSTRQGGDCMAFPDTCKTPTPVGTVPVPYPNTAMLMQANPATCSMKVMVLNQSVVTKQTQIPVTTGDEGGVEGGVVSSMIKGPAKFTLGSMKVKIEGQPAIYQTCMCSQNGTNANAPAGLQVSPSQTKVIVSG